MSANIYIYMYSIYIYCIYIIDSDNSFVVVYVRIICNRSHQQIMLGPQGTLSSNHQFCSCFASLGRYSLDMSPRSNLCLLFCTYGLILACKYKLGYVSTKNLTLARVYPKHPNSSKHLLKRYSHPNNHLVITYY